MTAEARAQYRSFLRREVPVRVIRDINNNLCKMPGFQLNPQLSERRFFEMISDSVWNAFDTVLPSLLLQTIPCEVTTNNTIVLEVATRFPDQCSPTISLRPQPMQISNLGQVSSNTANAAARTHEQESSNNTSFNALNTATSSPDEDAEVHEPLGLSPVGPGIFSDHLDHDFDYCLFIEEVFPQAPTFNKSPQA